MAIIDSISWQPPDNNALAYRYPEENLSTFTQLIVNESQEAVLFSKGQILGKFGPGKHTLSTENLPLLRNLFGIPFGGKNPFQSVVVFVNKSIPPTIPWITKKFNIYDPGYNARIPVISQGRFGIEVTNAECFLTEVVKTAKSFSVVDLSNVMWAELTMKLNSFVSKYMQTNRLSIMNISAYLEDISNFMKEPAAEFLERFGISLRSFNIDSIDVDETTEDGRKVMEAMTARTTQNIAGYSWAQQQAFDTANNAINNGGEMGMLGMALMMGGGMGGGMGAGMMQGAPVMNPVNDPTQLMAANQGMAPGGAGMMPGATGGMAAVPREVFCSACAKKFPSTSKFCPFCGNQYRPCPKCGSDNSPKARRCVSCGTPLASADPMVAGGMGGNQCSRCGQTVSPTLKFCPNCGNKLR